MMEAEPKASPVNNLDEAQVLAFKSVMRGSVFEPGDADYDTTRKVYNAMIDRHPRMIAHCADVADVIASVNLARKTGLLVSVRGGGHGVAGFAVCDDGLMIDLSGMRGIRVDPEKGTVRVEGGCVWADVDHATHAFGSAVPSGIVSTTGVAGLTLGGGHGHLTRHYGLTCDNLISADVVTADGRFVTASEDQNQDLFWGLRGGGGNFGVVTSFEFKLCPVNTVMGGPVVYTGDKSRDVMEFYRDIISNAPDNLNAFLGLHNEPPQPFIPGDSPDNPICVIMVCYSGPMENAEEAVRPFREFGPPDADMIASIPYPSMQTILDQLLPFGLQHYWKADFFNELSDDFINVHLDYCSRIPTFRSGIHIYPIDGAAHRVGKTDTAFNYRDANFSANMTAIYPNPEDTPEMVDWVRSYWSAAHPHSIGAAYVNFLMDEGRDRIKASYRGNYDQLVELKIKYDPDNLFKMNQNIKPTV